MNEYSPVDIEQRWQERWEEDDVFSTEVDEDREPYYVIFAYPGISGFLHLGHMRSYTYTDIMARYKQMDGFNVLFPVGTHPTGNQVISLSKKIKEGDEDMLAYLKKNGADQEDIERMKDPEEAVEFFNNVFKNRYWKQFGFTIDFDYFTYTTRDDYKQFIKWQFLKLDEKDLLTKKPYYSPECLECGPVAVDPSETDLSKGGNAEKQEYTLLKFEYGDRYITAATLRPETVYGQTNLWLDPEEEYVVVKVEDEEWIMSEEAAEKLSYQKDDVEVVDTIKGEKMVGDYATAPAIHRDIIILPASFTDPDMGTGIVTSVPSDAPYDWIALEDIKEDKKTLEKYGIREEVEEIEPIEIIDSEDWGTNPAESIIDEMGIRSQDEVEKLEEATQRIYKAGFHTGTMTEECGEYSGMKVQRAKDEIKNELIQSGQADVFYDLSEEVICRCGGKVIVGKIPDQWFIRYSDDTLTEKSKEQARRMNIKPQTYADNLPDTLEWFQDRSCARKGNWMGTQFPLDDEWVIEAIADSTLYPAFYPVAKYYNQGDIEPDQMTEDFFDYVYLGRGEVHQITEETGVAEEKLKEIRDEFTYWYPLDVNFGGKEHMTVHFPVFLMNHVAIFDDDKWPQGIFVNWWLSMKGGKISKSKGGAEPIPNVAETFGVDTIRLFYAHSSSPFVDKEWDEDEALNYKRKLANIWDLVQRISDLDGGESPIDDYLRSRLNRLVKEFRGSMDDYEIRDAANVVFYDIPSEIEWYLKRGGKNGELLDEVKKRYVKLLAPFTPHIAEELWHEWEEGYITQGRLPETNEEAISEKAEAEEEYLKDVRDDIRQILNVADVQGDEIYIYVSPQWKEEALNVLLENPEKGMGVMSELVDELDADPSEISSFVQEMVQKVKEKGEKRTWKVDMNEKKILKNGKEFLESVLEGNVHVYEEGEKGIHDPEGRADKSIPRRPAIYIE